MSDSVVVELKKAVKNLQNAVNEKDVVSILNSLKDKHVTEAILRESRVGLAVGKLRTHDSKAVSDLAKEIVKQWKTAVEKAKTKAGPPSATKATANGLPRVPERKMSASTPITPTGSSSVRSSKTDLFKASTGDTTRDRCVELIYDGLACDATAPNALVAEKAYAVEKGVWNNKGGTNAEYKSRIRSLFVNLKDKSNPGLRASIVDGSLSPEKFSKMTTEEMASEERKAADNKIREDNLFKSLSATEKEAETDAFQCSRCKQRKCVYRQQQTRSADEPMTTFVTCTVCKNKWKFS